MACQGTSTAGARVSISAVVTSMCFTYARKVKKIQIRDDPETVHSAWAQRGVNEKHRDGSYARVC